MKYRALSRSEGYVALKWHLESRGEGEQLRLTWQEHGGPAIVEPTRKGFGLKMIERALTAYVRGQIEIAYPASGRVFRLSAPVSALSTD